jgi:hypothetical protein
LDNRNQKEWLNFCLDLAEKSGNVGQFAVMSAIQILALKCSEMDKLLQDYQSKYSDDVLSCEIEKIRTKFPDTSMVYFK